MNGKTGNLGDDITLSREKNVISVVSGISLSKRYIHMERERERMREKKFGGENSEF